MTTSVDTLIAHLNGVAAYFEEHYESVDREGVVTTKNAHWFPQMLALGAIPQQLTWNLLNKLHPMLDEAKAKAFEARANNTGTEITLRKQAVAIEAYKRIAEKIQLQESAIQAAKEVYARHQGKAWTYFEPAAKANRDVDLSSVDAEFDRLFGAEGKAVNVAAGYGSNAPSTGDIELERLPEQHGRPRKAKA